MNIDNYGYPSLEKLMDILGFRLGSSIEECGPKLKFRKSIKWKDIDYDAYRYYGKEYESIFDLYQKCIGVVTFFRNGLLHAVDYHFEGDLVEDLHNEINNYLPTDIKLEEDPFVCWKEYYVDLGDGIFLELYGKDNKTRLSLELQEFRYPNRKVLVK